MSDPLLTCIQELRSTCEAQQRCIEKLVHAHAEQGEQIILLVQSVAMLLGEEMGTPVQDEAGETDMDGNPV